MSKVHVTIVCYIIGLCNSNQCMYIDLFCVKDTFICSHVVMQYVTHIQTYNSHSSGWSHSLKMLILSLNTCPVFVSFSFSLFSTWLCFHPCLGLWCTEVYLIKYSSHIFVNHYTICCRHPAWPLRK